MVEDSCGEELALDTGDAQNCRMSTGCSGKLSKDDQTRSSKTAGVVSLNCGRHRSSPFVYLPACLLACFL